MVLNIWYLKIFLVIHPFWEVNMLVVSSSNAARASGGKSFFSMRQVFKCFPLADTQNPAVDENSTGRSGIYETDEDEVQVTFHFRVFSIRKLVSSKL